MCRNFFVVAVFGTPLILDTLFLYFPLSLCFRSRAHSHPPFSPLLRCFFLTPKNLVSPVPPRRTDSPMPSKSFSFPSFYYFVFPPFWRRVNNLFLNSAACPPFTFRFPKDNVRPPPPFRQCRDPFLPFRFSQPAESHGTFCLFEYFGIRRFDWYSRLQRKTFFFWVDPTFTFGVFFWVLFSTWWVQNRDLPRSKLSAFSLSWGLVFPIGLGCSFSPLFHEKKIFRFFGLSPFPFGVFHLTCFLFPFSLLVFSLI